MQITSAYGTGQVSGSRDGRVWEQRRSRLGAEAVASGSRGGRVWGETRLNAGRRSLASRIFIKRCAERI